VSAPESAPAGGTFALPLFPLSTVLFPGGLLPLRIFEQRYIAMTKSCIADESAFGVCLIVKGSEVNAPGAAARGEKPEFATLGTSARIETWDMPEPGILHVRVRGGVRLQVVADAIQADGLVLGTCTAVPAEPAHSVPAAMQPLARLLAALQERIGAGAASERELDDASFVGYRLAELLPLPLTIKQSMLEMNDSEVRLAVIARFLKQQQVL
jgi:Lon protease-like protein